MDANTGTKPAELPVRPCPECGALLSARLSGSRSAASSFEDCLRQCAPCGIGLSNARTPGAETHIYRDFSANVPAGLSDGFLEALQASINQLNRANKLRKAAYSTSEDALTWTYFNHLRLTGRLRNLDFFPSSEEPRLVLWGTEVGAGTGSKIPKALLEVSTALGEDLGRRTEPDVILDFGKEGLAIIEVKYRSGNETKEASYPGWKRYVEGVGAKAFIDALSAPTSGCYELARNWRFGWELGTRFDVPVVVANLGPPSLFVGDAGRLLERFESHLLEGTRQSFMRMNWLETIERVPPECGLSEYFRAKYSFL